jgi:UDP-N-acetylmuramoyl-tripeptide--D-alanyl-D-alanine ligase
LQKITALLIEQLYQLYLQSSEVKTDTRKLQKNDIFFALSGENFNGNTFAISALEKGASYAIVDEDIDENNDRIIKVENVLDTLQQLAKYHRQKFSIPFLAITGSNGKTTTKELVHAVLSSHYIAYTTEGNLNNHIGIPLTLLRIKSDAEIAIIEMGANHQKEIEGYCKYVLPTHGIITNCGKAHLEGFGGIEGVKKGKGELFDYLRENNGSAFIYNDFDYLRSMSRGIKEVNNYGTKDASITGKVSASGSFLQVEITSGADIENIQTHLVGDYNLPNVLCAVAVGKYFNVPEQKIKHALETYSPTNSRSQMIEKGTNKIILDAYNANPTSTLAAIENFQKLPADNKILMLGGMAEVGEESLKEHQDIIDFIKKYSWKNVVLVGGDYAYVDHPFTFFKNADEAREWFINQSFEQTYFLIKGSRSMQMEKILL